MTESIEAKRSTKFSRRAVGLGFALGLLVGVGMLIGSWLTLSTGQVPIMIPEMPLHAVATDSGETFAICTGPISEEVEGIFTLDYLTGNLQCWVVDSRTGAVAGYFMHNVVNDLGMDATRKNPHYLMVTGRTGLRGGGSAVNFSDCVIYVADGNSGNLAGYVVPWNRNLANRGTAQKGPLTPIFKQQARNLNIRGQ